MQSIFLVVGQNKERRNEMEKCNDCKKMVKEAPFGQCDDCFEQSMKSDGSVIYSLNEEDRKEKLDD